MSSNQDEGERSEEASSNMVFDDSDSWNNHTIMTWDYGGANVIY
jgi:hypothetical protein